MLSLLMFVADQPLGMPSEDHDATPSRDFEQEIHRQLYDAMREVSRQRLRSMQMALRRYGNTESRISAKELQLVFQV